MQKPISSEKDGFVTWFMSLPFQTNDFIPSVTVGDQWFAASTSKDRAVELLKAAAAGGSTARTGAWLRVDFKPFQKTAGETMAMLEENADAIFGEDTPGRAQFDETKDLRDKLLEAMGDFDSLTFHSRREEGQLRSSTHFKTH